MKYLFITIIVAILFIYYIEQKKPIMQLLRLEKFDENKNQGPVVSELSWKDVVQKRSLDPSIEESHAKYVANTRTWSSGANFSSVADDNTSGITTNWLGFSRPRFVDIDPTARTIPDFDSEVLKRNKHIKFVGQYDGDN